MNYIPRFQVDPVPEDYPAEGAKLAAEIAHSVVEEAELFVVKSICTFLGQRKETEMYSVDKQKLIDAVRMYYHDPNVAQVVRCKDCKYYDRTEMFNCQFMADCVNESDFCSHGERRKDEIR